MHHSWNLYFHDLGSDWNKKSFHKLASFDNMKTFWEKQLAIHEFLEYGLFFYMRDNIFPSWESPENINGGSLSIRVKKDIVTQVWDEIAYLFVSNQILKCEFSHLNKHVNGVTISPKQHNNFVIQIWVNCSSMSNTYFFNLPHSYSGILLYTNHRKRILRTR